MLPKLVPNLRLGSARSSAFTLVETAMAVGVVAFAFVSLMALLPVGLTTFRRSIDTSVCAQIAQRVVNDAQQTDFDILIDQTNLEQSQAGEGFTFRAPTIAAPALRYFDDQGMEVVPLIPPTPNKTELARIMYYVSMRVMPQASLPRTDGASAHNGRVHPEDVAQLTIQIAHNPGHRSLIFSSAPADRAMSPDRNLLNTSDSSMRGIDVLTYSALVGRNL